MRLIHLPGIGLSLTISKHTSPRYFRRKILIAGCVFFPSEVGPKEAGVDQESSPMYVLLCQEIGPWLEKVPGVKIPRQTGRRVQIPSTVPIHINPPLQEHTIIGRQNEPTILHVTILPLTPLWVSLDKQPSSVENGRPVRLPSVWLLDIDVSIPPAMKKSGNHVPALFFFFRIPERGMLPEPTAEERVTGTSGHAIRVPKSYTGAVPGSGREDHTPHQYPAILCPGPKIRSIK